MLLLGYWMLISMGLADGRSWFGGTDSTSDGHIKPVDGGSMSVVGPTISQDAFTLEEMIADLRDQSAFGPEVFSSLHLLGSGSRKTDCLAQAVSRLKVRCVGASGGDVISEGERSDIAIALTLCDLQTADLSPPMECDTLADDRATLAARTACIQALSRSTQFWSSFSGYIRETTLVCLAFERSRSVDVAHDIYRNATFEKLALLRDLRAEVVRKEEWDERLRAVARQLRSELLNLSDLDSHLAAVVQALRNLTSPEEIQRFSQNLASQLSDHVDVLVLPRFHDALDVQINDLRTAHSEVIEELSRTQLDWTAQVESEGMRALQALRTNALDSTLNVSLSVLETRDGLAQLSSAMQSLAEGVDSAFGLVHNLGPLLLRSHELALETQVISAESHAQISSLSLQLANLTNTLSEYTDAVDLRLSHLRRSGSEWVHAKLVGATMAILQALGRDHGDASFAAVKLIFHIVIGILGRVADSIFTLLFLVLAWSFRRVRTTVGRLPAPLNPSDPLQSVIEKHPSTVPAIKAEGLSPNSFPHKTSSLHAPVSEPTPPSPELRPTPRLPLLTTISPNHSTPSRKIRAATSPL